MNKTDENKNNFCIRCNKFFGTPELLGFCSVCFKLEHDTKKMSFDEPNVTEKEKVNVIPAVEKVEEVIKPAQVIKFIKILD